MKISKNYLKQVIKEELEKEINKGWKNKLAGLAIGASALVGGLTPTDAHAGKPNRIQNPDKTVDAASLGQIEGDKIILNNEYKDSWMRLQMAELIANTQGKTITKYRSETKNDDGKTVFTGVELRKKGTR